MVEAIMYFAIGFLAANLISLGVIPLVHGRAERLTIKRLQQTIPLSVGEIQAEKDLLRANFAMSTCRLETKIDGLRSKMAGQLADLSRKTDTINKLKADRIVQSGEIIALKCQVEALEERLQLAGVSVNASLFRRIYSAASRAKAA